MSANFIDLTTVSAVAGLLNQSSTIDAALIQTEITNLSRYILTRTSRNYLGGFLTYAERYNGNGSDTLMLRNYPVLAVTSLSVNGVTIPQSPDYMQSGWAIDTSGSQASVGIIGACSSGYEGFSRWTTWSGNGNAPPLGQPTYRFWEGLQNVAIIYTAGTVTTQYFEAQLVPASPGPYTVTVANAAKFFQDLGVITASGATVTGYTVSSAGVYTIPASYQGQTLQFTYQYGAVPQDLQECATKVVATYYRRPKYLDQSSQMQPGVGTTSYARQEWAPECTSIIEKYRRVFLD